VLNTDVGEYNLCVCGWIVNLCKYSSRMVVGIIISSIIIIILLFIMRYPLRFNVYIIYYLKLFINYPLLSPLSETRINYH